MTKKEKQENEDLSFIDKLIEDSRGTFFERLRGALKMLAIICIIVILMVIRDVYLSLLNEP